MVAGRAPEVVLRHPCRAAIQAALHESPGIHFLGLVRAVGSPRGTVRHHVDVLARSGVLRQERLRRRLILMPHGHPERTAAAALLCQPGMSLLRDLLSEAGPLCQMEIRRRVAWPRSTVQHRLERLVAVGVVRASWQGRHRFYWTARASGGC